MPTSQLSAAPLSFLQEFLQDPFSVGSVVPSSSALAGAMLGDLDMTGMKLAVEYGPGTGAFTKFLAESLPPAAQLTGFEPNAQFRRHLQAAFPQMRLYSGYAAEIGAHMGEARDQVDLVVSGLPFSLMDWHVVESTLHETHQMLRPGGHFRTFIYFQTMPLPKIRRLMRFLRARFASVEVRAVFRNFPPAFVVRCVK